MCLYLRPKVHRISETIPKKIKGGVLIASNHKSMLDPIILFCVFWYRRLYFPAAGELFEKSINRFFFYNMNCIEIDRSGPNIGALKAMCKLLSKGKVIAIFPEGRINTSKELADFKVGAAYMARRTGCPVLPVYIAERENRYSRVHVIIGEPVDVREICEKYSNRNDALAEVSRRLRYEELRLVEYYNNEIKKCRAHEVTYV